MVSGTTIANAGALTAPGSGPGRPASHRVDIVGDHVVIRDLELFVAYDPEIDGEDDKRMKQFRDEDAIAGVVEKTRKHMARGQNPKLIPEHNDGERTAGNPAVGDIVEIRQRDINGRPGIAGDIEMSVGDFEVYLKSNRYPRRSAEIWEDGFLSEVALLGAETPARPLPDTRFAAGEPAPMRFSRTYAEAEYTLGTVNKESPTMADTKTKPEKFAGDHDDDMKARLAELEEENKSLRAKLKAKNAADDDDKDKSKNARDGEVEQFRKENETLRKDVSTLRADLTIERYGRKLDADVMSGLQVGDKDRRDGILERIATSQDPEAEYQFHRKGFAQLPVERVGRVDQHGARVDVPGGGNEPTLEQRTKAANAARDRCTREGGDRQQYAKYLAEELDKLTA